MVMSVGYDKLITTAENLERNGDVSVAHVQTDLIEPRYSTAVRREPLQVPSWNSIAVPRRM